MKYISVLLITSFLFVIPKETNAQDVIGTSIVSNKGQLKLRAGFGGNNNIKEIQKGQVVSILNVADGDYVMVRYTDQLTNDKYEGFMHMVLLENKQLIEKSKFGENVKLGKLTSKYGEELGKKLYNGKIEIGMTRKMVIDALGLPNDENTTEVEGLTSVQMVYGNMIDGNTRIVYTENGIVSALQNF